MGWMDVNQSPSWDETMLVAKKYIDEGRDVRIHPQKFIGWDRPEAREHTHPIEYEVSVLF